MRRVALAPIAGAAKLPEAVPGEGKNYKRWTVTHLLGITV